MQHYAEGWLGRYPGIIGVSTDDGPNLRFEADVPFKITGTVLLGVC
jgi:hypothetical protein